MSLPRYPEYKESGIPWLGKVPSHWIKRTLQDTARSGRNAFVDGPFGSDLKSEEYADDGTPLIQLNNVSVGKHDLTNLKFIPMQKADELARHKAIPGDIVIAKMAAPVARAAIVSSYFEQFVIVADCVKLSVDATQWSANFLQYWINSSGVNAVAETLSAGITRLRINLGSLKKLPVFQTSLSEQTAIATFLDRETGKIDALIAEQEKLLTLLAEKRQATISHAVTKGLNPDAPMKDSGVAWLGEVPAHWNVARVKALSVFTTSGPRGWSDRITEGGSLFIQSGDLNDSMGLDYEGAKRVDVGSDAEAARTRLTEGDVVVCITGAKTGNVALCSSLREPAYVNQHLCLIRPSHEVHGRFLAHSLKSTVGQTQFEVSQYGLKQGLSLENVRELWVAHPPLHEQEAIVAFLDAETEKLDALKNESERAIILLKERRSALIAAAVTGQIDVRDI